jgi:16S rRNA (guanine966-N2)-methyltransferase
MPDRARQSLFDMLRDVVAGARVLDLYCGCGTMGLEALSRGAGHATFVDSGKRAGAALRQNLDALALPPERWTILDIRATQALATLARQEARFDLVFLDPPFADLTPPARRARVAAELAAAAGRLVPGGRLLFRIETGTPPFDGAPLRPEREKTYGRSHVFVWRQPGPPGAETPA